MSDRELRALSALRFNYAQTPDDVWRPSQFHVDGLHRRTAHLLLDGLGEARETRDASPIGVVVQGQRGAGKTHLLGWVREQVQREGGYFFLVGLLDAKGFWESTVVSILDGLSRETADGESQLKTFLWRLSSLVEVPRMVRRAVTGDMALTKTALDTFIDALRRYNGEVGRDSRDTARALVLRACNDLRAQDIGDTFLSSALEEERGERAMWGMRPSHRSPQEIVRDLSRLMALTGPTIVAVDQIDMLIAQSSITDEGALRDRHEALVIEQIAHGLMSLRDVTRRTLTVVSCLPATWVLIDKFATDTIRDRFRQAVQLKTLPNAETGRTLIEKRFTAQFGAIGFVPPYPTWPVKPEAFDLAPDFTPRQLLIKIDSHIRSCLLDGEVKELERLGGPVLVDDDSTPTRPDDASAADLAVIEARFVQLRDAANPEAAKSFITEDLVMPELLSAGLTSWIAEQGEAGRVFSPDPPPSTKPPLHARLRRTLNEATEDEAHWAFRAISAENPIAALNRLRTASVAAGLDLAVPKRRLFLLRNTDWSGGPRTREAVAAFEQAGGITLPIEDDDLKILAALRDLIMENPPHLHAWFVTRRPAGDVKLFKEALDSAWTVPAVRGGLGTSERPNDQTVPQGQGPRAASGGPGDQPIPAPQGETTPTAPGRPTGRAGRISPGGSVDGIISRGGAAGISSGGSVESAVRVGHAERASFGGSVDRVVSGGGADGLGSGQAVDSAVRDGHAERVPSDGPIDQAVSDGVARRTPSGETDDRVVPHAEGERARSGGSGDVVLFGEGERGGLDGGGGWAVSPIRPSGVHSVEPVVSSITIGRAIAGDRAVGVELEALRKHTAIFAGSGSGKTVLIRRLVEECALRGVSAIVLDPNNDLARLGDGWPEPPVQWGEGDAALAEEYLANTDVVVWTPLRVMGRPLSFQPLPDFASVIDDADEFAEAVEVAVASIVPKAKLDANTNKAQLGQAVLRETLKYYGRRGRTSLKGLIDVLSALPDGVSELDNAARIAAGLAQILTAATVNDRLFGGEGAAMDPGLLLTPPAGKRARVSVISLVGLQSDEQRQSFVNQLQMALFAWIKKHPAGDRPLGGLFVMDEAQTFAPSGAMTPCTQSTLALASQARKYGLGLVFATQAPKGLHNRIPGNAATQFFGLMNSSTQIATAKEMAQAKGGDVADISRLTTGQFYAATEGNAFVKVQTPLCLSHHPKSPLTTEEVIERAKDLS